MGKFNLSNSASGNDLRATQFMISQVLPQTLITKSAITPKYNWTNEQTQLFGRSNLNSYACSNDLTKNLVLVLNVARDVTLDLMLRNLYKKIPQILINNFKTNQKVLKWGHTVELSFG